MADQQFVIDISIDLVNLAFEEPSTYSSPMCLRAVIDQDDGMLSQCLAENRCGNFQQLNRRVAD
jgi:hypothetical protein